jgi:hypothetical protein
MVVVVLVPVVVAVLVVAVPVAIVVPLAFRTVPPAVVRAPATLALFIELMAAALGLRTALAIAAHGLVQPAFRFFDTVLTFRVIIARVGTRCCPK